MPTRVYEIAKKCGVESIAVLRKAKELGISAAKVPSSSLDKITAEYLAIHVQSELVSVKSQASKAPTTLVDFPALAVQQSDQVIQPPTAARESDVFEGGVAISIVGECLLSIYRLVESGFEITGSFLLRTPSDHAKANAKCDLAQVVAVANPESSLLEFKPSVKFDAYQKRENPDLARSVVKTVAAFLNSEGGTLLIGVADSGQVIGLEKDIATFQRRNRDQLEQFLHSLILDRLGSGLSSCIQIRFSQIGDKEVCVIRVRRSHRPVFLREGNEEAFYLRTGNASKRLNMSAAVDYCSQIWPSNSPR